MVYVIKDGYKDALRTEFDKQRMASNSMREYEEKNFPSQKYLKWVKEQEENNKVLSEILVKQRFITEQDTVSEIGNHIKNSISQHLHNPHNFIIPNVGKIDYNIEGILLIKGITNGEKGIVSNVDLTKISVILCVCSQKAKYYERCTTFFEKQTKGLDFKKVIQEIGNQKIYIAKNNIKTNI